jgi:hypothetical protein
LEEVEGNSNLLPRVNEVRIFYIGIFFPDLRPEERVGDLLGRYVP